MVESIKPVTTSSTSSIKYEIPQHQYELTATLKQNISNLLNGFDGDDDHKKEQLWKTLLEPLAKEFSETILTVLEDKRQQTIKHYESKAFLAKSGLFDHLIQINKNIECVHDSLSLLRYYKHDKPASYAPGMYEDFQKIQNSLIQLNNFIHTIFHGKPQIIHINPIRLLDFLDEADVTHSNYDENFLLLPSEIKPTHVDFSLVMNEKAYLEVAIPSESEASRLREQVLGLVNDAFDKLKTLFTVEAIGKIVNWDEINAVLRGEEPVAEQPKEKEGQDSPQLKELTGLIDKVSKQSPSDSLAQQDARTFMVQKFKAYLERLNSHFATQIKENDFKKVTSLDEYFRKLILEYSHDHKNYTERILKIITDDMVNYFFTKRITVSPLLEKVEGIGHYFDTDAIEFKLIDKDVITASVIEGYFINFLKHCQQDKYAYVSRAVPKRYLCLVTRTKVDFYLFEYEYLAGSEGVNVYMSNTSLEGVLHQALPKVTMAMPSGLKHTFRFFNLVFLEPRFNLDYKQVWLNYYAPSTKDNTISDLFHLLIYATIYILCNHKYERSDKQITIDAKYFFYFTDKYLDFQECYSHPSPTVWSDNFLFGIVPFPFKKPIPKTPRKSVTTSLENPIPVPRNVNQVMHQPLFEKNVHLIEARNGHLKETIAKIAATDCLYLDGQKFLNSFISASTDLAEKIQIVWPESAYWKAAQALLDGSEPSEKFNNHKIDEKYASTLLLPLAEFDRGLLLASINHTQKKVVLILKESAIQSHWNDNQPATFRKSLEDLFERSFEGYTTAQVAVSFATETVEAIFHKFYFPKIHLIQLLGIHDGSELLREGKAVITETDVLSAYEKFIHLNLFVVNPEVYRAYNIYYQNTLESNSIVLVSIGNWKLVEFITALKNLDQTLSSGIPNVYFAFVYYNICGNSVYYLTFTETSDYTKKEATIELESKEEKKPAVPTYQLTIFSLNSNKLDDDVELIKEVINYFRYIHKYEVTIKSSYKVNSEANLILSTKYDMTLLTLAYLKEIGKMDLVEAFKTIGYSSLAHYKEINSMITLINHEIDTSKAKKEESQANEEESKEPKEQSRISVGDTQVVNGYISDDSKGEDIRNALHQKMLDQLRSGSLKHAYYWAIEHIIEDSNKSINRTSVYNHVCGRNTLPELLAEEDEAKLEAACTTLANGISEAMKAKVPANLIATNDHNVKVFMVLPLESYREYDKLALIVFRPHLDVAFKLYYISLEEMSEMKPPEKLVNVLQKLRNAFKPSFKVAENSEICTVHVGLGKDFHEIIMQTYYLSVFYLVHSLLTLKAVEDDEASKSLTLEVPRFLQLLNEQTHYVYHDSISNSEFRKKFHEILKAFFHPSAITKKSCLLSFSAFPLKIEGIGALRTLVHDLKKLFVANETLSYFVLGFNLAYKKSMKHYMTVWKREEGEEVSITVFTNQDNEGEDIVDKLVGSYLIEKFEEFDKKLKIKELTLYRGAIQHNLIFAHVDLAVYLMAYLVCNKELPPNEAFNLLSSSALLFATEFHEFEEKTRSL